MSFLNVDEPAKASDIAPLVQNVAAASKCATETPAWRIHMVTKEFCWFYNMPDVGTDKWMILPGKTKVGTKGLGPCFTIAMRGLTTNNVPVLGLSHEWLG
jgi:hypothetical protein